MKIVPLSIHRGPFLCHSAVMASPHTFESMYWAFRADGLLPRWAGAPAPLLISFIFWEIQHHMHERQRTNTALRSWHLVSEENRRGCHVLKNKTKQPFSFFESALISFRETYFQSHRWEEEGDGQTEKIKEILKKFLKEFQSLFEDGIFVLVFIWRLYLVNLPQQSGKSTALCVHITAWTALGAQSPLQNLKWLSLYCAT